MQQQSMIHPIQNHRVAAEATPQNYAFPLVPRLLPDLRLALATLYSIPLPIADHHHQHHARPTPAQAHDFLIQIQSRNVRRKIISFQQKLRDQKSRMSLHQQATPLLPTPRDSAWQQMMGSSWLACLAILCQVHDNNHCHTQQQQQQQQQQHNLSSFVASTTERLFAAQTLVHRLRRNKAVEAIDMEMELCFSDNNHHGDMAWQQWFQENDSSSFHVHVAAASYSLVASSYQEWMRRIHPGIAHVLEAVASSSSSSSYHPTDQTTTALMKNEEQIKLEFTLLTLAAVGFYQMRAITTAATTTIDGADDRDGAQGSGGGGGGDCMIGNSSQTPLLETIMSALVMTALRLRHCSGSMACSSSSSSMNLDDNNSMSNCCLVTLIRDAFHVVSLSVQHQHQQYDVNSSNNNILRMCLHTSLAVIPDTILASPGGTRGRLSMDPRSVQQSIRELRTKDMPALWDILQQDAILSHSALSGNAAAAEQQAARQNEYLILKTCARWASLLALPHEFIEYTIPLIRKHFGPSSNSGEEHREMALSYLLALVEGASWTAEQVLSMNLGLSSDPSSSQQQANKKRQSSRSKKRHKEGIERESSNDIHAQAQSEIRHRGDMACLAILQTWDQLSASARVSISDGHANGEGPVGCLAAAANSCMPHLLRYPDFTHGTELFQVLSANFQLLCSSPNKTIRALSFEPLYSLHTAMVEVARMNGGIDSGLEQMVVDHFVKCALSLASSCGYPNNYFANLGERSDEDIEIERNDVRDVLRTVAGSGEGGSTSDVVSEHGPLRVTSRVLSAILHSCREAVTSTNCPETAIHAFSSLAKPLNFLAKYSCQGGTSDTETKYILNMASALLCEVCQLVVQGFKDRIPVAELLPRARIVDITIASLCPMIAARCQMAWSLRDFAKSRDGENLAKLLYVALEASILSIENLPELVSESQLRQAQYDIRGTMRSPGGEDHVGCLSILRMANENDALTLALVGIAKPLMPRLCKLLQFLKSVELERGFGVHYGKGVCPQSRRILLGVICRLEMVSQGCGGASEILSEVFDHVVITIASLGSRGPNETALAQMAEATFDLAAFPPAVLSTLFADENVSGGPKTVCLEALTSSCLHGYQQQLATTTRPEFTESTVQWNRLRAALFQLLIGTANPDLPNRAVEILCACIKAECEAIKFQCNVRANYPSAIFNDHVISPDVVPSGLFVQAVAQLLHIRNSNVLLSNCVAALISSKSHVIETILLPCADPSAFLDPRPTLTEAWLLAMIELCNADFFHTEQKFVLVDTAAAMISLLFFPTMGKTEAERRNDSGMSLDGPHSLVLLSFLADFFSLGPLALESVASKLASIVPIDNTTTGHQSRDSTVLQCASIGAALFRAVQGSLPPWAVEFISSVYSGLFVALGKDPRLFGELLRLSMEVRLRQDFAGVKAGELLSGRFFHNISTKSKEEFIDQAVELCHKDNPADWKKLKGLIKQMCGGKKKDTDFKQKPALTRWEFIRL